MLCAEDTVLVLLLDLLFQFVKMAKIIAFWQDIYSSLFFPLVG